MVFTKFATVLAVTAAVAVADASAMPRVHPGVHRTLRAQSTINLIVTMKAGVEEALNVVQEADYTTRGAKIESIVNQLEKHAAASQVELAAVIAQESSGSEFAGAQSFWVSNQISFKGATFGLVEKLAALPTIAEIREELVLPVPKFTVKANTTTSFRPLANEWGITKVKAPEVWAAGNNGRGIVVGAIDTGVLGTHTALKSNYRSTYGWYDPGSKKTAPYDDNGHGTHTMGTIAGSGGVGVAPGATWIACRGCTNDGCTESDLLACAQFMTCPTDAAGANKDCTKAPRLVSNSWGGGQGDTFYAAAIKTWRAADIIPIFANGNEGPSCSTASSPGDDANVIAVGATDSTDGLASFSSKGPAVNGLVKPEVSGPGVDVRSAWNTGTSAYSTISGTSMATPHVSGIVALLLSAKSSLKYDDIKSLLTSTVDTSTLKASGYTCGSTKDTVYPNNQYGYGRVNAFTAFKAVGATPTTAPTSAPTPAPTTKAPTPTTKAPTPTTTTPAPTTKTPAPTTKTPAPTTKTPAPTSKTPAPTTAKPNKCAGLSFWTCSWTSGCEYSWLNGCYAV